MENRIIRVKGVGKASMAPDQITINITLKSSDNAYEKAMKIANTDLENLRESLEREGIEKNSIKTVNFNVDTKYENETTAFDNYKRKFVGYEVNHSLKVEIENNSEKLTNALNGLTKSKSNPEFSIIYNLKDSTKLKDQMLENAISDSKRKAQAIAVSAGVVLGEIAKIDYSWDEVEVFSSPLNLQRNLGLMNEQISIVPEDLESTDTVEISWKIEG